MVKQTIKIFCRAKPTRLKTGIFSIDDDDTLPKSTVEFVVPRDQQDGFVNNKREAYKFSFEKVFDQQSKQDAIFDHVAKDVVDNVLSGYNGTIFAYGQTGSGKTFTITGGAEKFADRGIIPRSLSYIFEKYEEDKGHIYSTEISYLEIYNENGYDLLDPRHEAAKLEDLQKVLLMEDPDQNIHLKNLSLLPAQNIEDALNLLFLGDTNRMIAETPMNQASTRSHCIFTIHITSREPGSATIRRSKLHLVDLAGSERVTKTNVGGQLLTEAKYINLSLHFLEQVIIALSEKSRQHIPYRNSMMTSVLRDSLGGNCMTTMIATVAIDKKNVDESISTCRFAQRVAMIKNEATLNEELDPKLMILRLKKEIQSLKDELALVTGEQRSDQLTKEEIELLDEMITNYLKDTDLEATLDVGGDMRKIQYSYSALKKHTLKQGVPSMRESNGFDKSEDSLGTTQNLSDNDGALTPHEIKRLKEILEQRDMEINILVNMLKKERKRAMDAESQLGTSHQTRSGVNSAPGVLPYNSAAYESSPIKTEDSVQFEMKSRVKDPDMSAGRQEAFEIFKENYAQNQAIIDQKERLKQRYAEAKALGLKVNESRNTMNKLKSEYEQFKKQRAIRATMSGSDDSFEDNEQEALIRHQMEEEKAQYKECFMKLKAMKAEIDHLHHLLDRTRVQMQRDFDVWWSQQGARPPSGKMRPKSAQKQLFNGNGNWNPDMPLPPTYIKTQEAWKTPPDSPQRYPKPPAQPSNVTSVQRTKMPMQIGREPVKGNFRLPAPAFRLPMANHMGVEQNSSHSAPSIRASPGENGNGVLQRSMSSGTRVLKPMSDAKIPLTGDKDTDANIMAFIKARESLMKRKGPYG